MISRVIGHCVRVVVAMLVLALVVVACTREEERGERSPIARVTLPERPLTSPRAADVVAKAGAPSPSVPRPPAATVLAPPAPSPVEPKPGGAATPPPAATAAAPSGSPAPPSGTPAGAITPGPGQPLAGVVGKGVDLRVAPSLDARVRGTFEGRTDVEVVAEKEGWSLVRAPVVTGGFVEGWVLSSSVRPPGEVQTARAPVAPKAAAQPKPAAGGAKPAPAGAAPQKAPAAVPPAAKAAPKAAAGGRGVPADKGPDNILLKPIEGTAKKQPATPFTHKAHWDEYSIDCVSCHHKVKALGGIQPKTYTCTDAGCHTANMCDNKVVPKKNAACPFFEDAYHIQCIGCHKKDGGPTKCKECHTG